MFKKKITKVLSFLMMILFVMNFSDIRAEVIEEAPKDMIINDSQTGTGLFQFNYEGNWGYSSGYPSRFHEGDEHWFNYSKYNEGDPQPNYTIKFRGDGIELFGEKQPGLGIYNVYLDDQLIESVDAYSSSQTKVKLFSKTDIPYGVHTLKVEISGKKNDSSTGYSGEIDYARIINPGQVEYENLFNINDIDNKDKSLTYNGEIIYDASRYSNMFTTHPIAVEKNDTISWGLFGKDEYVLEVYDENDNFIKRVLSKDIEIEDKQTTVIGVDGKTYTEAIASYNVESEDAAYVRILGNISTKDKFMVFKNLENGILDWPDEYIPYNTQSNSKLNGKSVLFVGDSITNAVKDEDHPYIGWAGRIGSLNNMEWKNAGISSATISTALPTSYPENRVVNQLSQDRDYDYIIMHGGMNDSIAETEIGEITESFDIDDFDIDTFSGGMEELIYTAKNKYPNAFIGYIVNYATPNSTWGGLSADNKAYFDQAKKICDKWDVPYIDLFEGGVTEEGVYKSYSNDILKVNTGENMYNGLSTEIHLGTKGYDIISPYIQKWMEEDLVKKEEVMNASVGSTYKLETQDDYAELLEQHQDKWNGVAWKGDVLNSKIVTVTKESEVHNAEIIVSDFISGENKISSANVEVKWLKDVLANIGRGNSSAPVKPFPDVIYKGGKIDIEAESVQSAWMNINVPKDAKPGTYNGSVTVNADELKEPYIFEYEFEVLDIVLPETNETDTQVQIWQHPFSVANYYGVKEEDYFTEEHFKYMRASMEEYKELGGKDVVANIVEEAWNHQSYYGDPSMVKWTKKADGTFEFDYTWYDSWIDFQVETGVLDPENGIGQIKSYSIVPWNNQVAYYDESQQKIVKKSYTPGSDEWKAIWKAFLEDYMEHSKEKGWFDITYISMDERGLDQLIPAVELIKSIKDKDGNSFKISSAFNYGDQSDSEFTDQIEDISINLDHFSDTSDKMREMSTHRRELGLTTTIYTCTGNYPGNFTISDPVENTWIMWYSMTHQTDGFMRWAWDNWVQDPLTNVTYKYWEPGDGWFIYPVEKSEEGNPDYYYSTPRYEMFKEGVRDVNKAKYLMEQTEEMNDKVNELVISLKTPAMKTYYGSAVAASDEEKDVLYSGVQRMQDGLVELSKEYLSERVVLVDEIVIDTDSITLEEGKEQTIQASVEPKDATDKTLIWSSEDESIAVVDNNGKITAVKEGTTYITVSSADGNASSMIKVEVKKPIILVDKITIDTDSITLEEGKEQTIQASVEPKDATDKTLVWNSKDESIAVVDNNGKITAVKEGTTYITVSSADGNASSVIKVEVKKPVEITPPDTINPDNTEDGENTEVTINGDKGDVVNTGDNSNIALLSIAVIISLSALVILFVGKKKRVN